MLAAPFCGGRGNIAMTYRVTTFYLDTVNNVGWTENWWTNASGTADSIAIAWRTTLSTLRGALLLDTCKILSWRACNVDHPRDSYFSADGSSGAISHTAQSPDAPWSCLQLRRDVVTFNLFGHIFMRGVPQTIFVGRVYTPGSGYGVTFDANLAAWRTSLLTLQAALRKGPAPGYTYPLFQNFYGGVRSERKPGRPFDTFRGRRAVA